MVRDILPLYVDEVCSPESRAFVDEHIAGCPECAAVLEKLKNNTCVEDLREEGEEVVLRHAKREKRKSVVVATVIAGVLMIPVLVCMIVNLATGHGLDWFFIVAASLLVFASLTVVPLVAVRYKGLWTLGSFTASLLLLYAICCAYSHGHWFGIAASSTLFGLAVIFMPFVARVVRTGFFSQHKALLVILTDTVLFALMMFSIGESVRSMDYWRLTISICSVFLVFIWVILLLARYVKVNGLIRAGAIVFWCTTFAACANNIIHMLLGYAVVWHAFHPFVWNGSTINGNINWVVFIAGAVIGGGLILGGILVRLFKNPDSKEAQQ